MKKLPLGIKSIQVLLTNNYLYIDKTKYYEKYMTSSKRVLALSVGGFNDKNVRYLLEEIT